MEGRPLRIALLHPTFWPEVMRGTERYLAELGTALAARGHQVTLLTSHRGPGSRGRERGMEVRRRRRPPPLPTLALHERHLENVPNAVAGLLRGRFDVAHAHFPSDAWAAARARQHGGPPLICTLHGVPTREYLVARRYRLEMLRTVAAEAAAIAVGSEAAARACRTYLLCDPEVIAPGVDADAFAVEAERSAEPTLICASALGDPRKRGALLLEAFARLRRTVPGVRLLLIRGRDPVMSGAEPAAAAGVEWLEPESETAALAARYAGAWASVLPAVEEAFGMVLVESLAAGTPVVADRSGAGPEIVDSERVGRLFERDDPADLARAMGEALELGRRPQTAEACRERAREFSWERTADAYEALYRAALSSPSGARASQK
jgi:phosphatidylinositol alpha-mannosyltransferase